MAREIDGVSILCDDCLDSGWNVDREGRSPCTCISETEPYQLLAKAAERVLEEPYGCPFCHSGHLIDPQKDHNEDCGFAMLRKALGE